MLDPTTVAYLDLTGSGVETIAHLRENGRITVMLCAFEGPPRIVRLYGTGEVVVPGDPEFGAGRALPERAGGRAVIRSPVDRLSSSCGYSVPFMDLVGEAPTLDQWAERKSPDELDDYRAGRTRSASTACPGSAEPGQAVGGPSVGGAVAEQAHRRGHRDHQDERRPSERHGDGVLERAMLPSGQPGSGSRTAPGRRRTPSSAGSSWRSSAATLGMPLVGTRA